MGASDARVDAVHAELLSAGERAAQARVVLEALSLDDNELRALLRRAVPLRFLELLARTEPWCGRPRVLAAVVSSPRASRRLALDLLPSLYWRDLAQVATTMRLPLAIRQRAEASLRELLPRLGVGDRISLARLASAGLLVALLVDGDPRVVRAALLNQRLTEGNLLRALRSDDAGPALFAETATSSRWGGQYPIRLGLVLQPRTPLAVSLAQITSLNRRDLGRIIETAGLPPLVHAAAARARRESDPR